MFIVKVSIDKISRLSCQKVAYSIISLKMGNNVAELTSVLLRNISECIRRYPSANCTVLFLINRRNHCTVLRGVVGKAIISQYKKHIIPGHIIRSVLYSFSFFFPCLGEGMVIYFSPDVS